AGSAGRSRRTPGAYRRGRLALRTDRRQRPSGRRWADRYLDRLQRTQDLRCDRRGLRLQSGKHPASDPLQTGDGSHARPELAGRRELTEVLVNKSQSNALTKRQKAAILMVAIGPEAVGKLFKHLREEDIENLTLDVARLGKVTPDQRRQTIAEFHEMCLAQ